MFSFAVMLGAVVFAFVPSISAFFGVLLGIMLLACVAYAYAPVGGSRPTEGHEIEQRTLPFIREEG